MLINFFETLRRYEIPVTFREFLDLLAALEGHIAFCNLEDFYFLSRSVMIKDEKYFDRFDRAFDAYFKDLESIEDVLDILIPEEWLREKFLDSLSEEEKAKIESLESFEELIKAFKERLAEQDERHEGGNKWIGSGGTSPFGNSGYHPEGILLGGEGKNKKAVKVWQRREFADLDDDVRIGTRNIKMALLRLRKFLRQGIPDQLDLAGTVRSTADNAGLLDIKTQPERRNMVKALLFLDVGGSMDPFVKVSSELFSAARSTLKYLEYFYFHNFIYESVWENNYRRHRERYSVVELLRKFGSDYKLIFVGDAAMSPYEILQPGGSVEHWNDQPGSYWMKRLIDHFDRVVWLNPLPPEQWQYNQSVEIVSALLDDKMFPLNLRGLNEAMASLMK